MEEVLTRPATAEDFERLGIVAPAAYAAAYHHMWPKAADLARQLETFGERALREFAGRPDAHLWIAEADGVPVGFLTLLENSPDPVIGGAGGAEVPRIFLLPNVRGRGIGRTLFSHALEAARATGMRYIWLDAMDTADWSIGAYLKWGFRRVGTSVFPRAVASQLKGMVVFRMELDG